MRKKEENGIIKIGYLPIKEIPVDKLTKPLNGVSFTIFRKFIGIINQA